jgi:hypothetical protein
VVEGTFQDCRFALRTFRRSLGFTALLRLGLGIRGNTAVLSVIDGVLLHPIPFPDSNRLVALYQKTPRDQKNAVSVSQFLGLAAVMNANIRRNRWRAERLVHAHGHGEPEQLMDLTVSSNLFSVLRIQPLIGKMFTREEDQRGARPVVLLGLGNLSLEVYT